MFVHRAGRQRCWSSGLSTALAGGLLVAAVGCDRPPAESAQDAALSQTHNIMAMAVAWKETAAEYDALYLQGFNVARMHVERALAERIAEGEAGRRPLAVITDLDDTVLDTRDYWREQMASGEQLFNDARWDIWVKKNRVRATPGALQFLNFCRDSGVEVFYITQRDQGPETMAFALANIKTAGLPFADEDHVTVLRDDSNKQPRQREIADTRDVVVYLGDNLNDFSRDYYLSHWEARRERLAEDRVELGRRFVLFPNPTDGHWVRAIFGESEPPATSTNLSRLHRILGRP
jgi:5'-nucleotidase (lipoprotein e(P4) family)